MSADIIQFRPISDAERDTIIARARANYESVFPSLAPTTDGGKARILRRRDNFKFRASDGKCDIADDLIMDHADNGVPSDVAYCAPESDPA